MRGGRAGAVAARRCCRRVLCELRQVSPLVNLCKSRNGTDGSVAGGRGCAHHRTRQSGLADRGIFRAAEEEQLVLQDRAADIAAEAVVIEARILRSIAWCCVAYHYLVDGVQVSVLKILVP